MVFYFVVIETLVIKSWYNRYIWSGGNATTVSLTYISYSFIYVFILHL